MTGEKIELSKEEIELFKWFRQYQHIWEETKKICPGSLTLHFDSNNSIKKYEIHFYKKHGKIKKCQKEFTNIKKDIKDQV